MVDPVVTGALIWLARRVVDRGFDRIFDATFDARQRQPAVTPRRHDLSVDGAQGTSDLDVDVRYHHFAGRMPVILTFQKFGTNSGGTTFPMVLGDTAHLTLRRDHYLVAALVVGLPDQAGAAPTLQGVGWTHEWVADNHVRTVAITTQHPTEQLVSDLGLVKSDGTCPFALAAPPPEPADDWPALPEFPPWLTHARQQGIAPRRRPARRRALSTFCRARTDVTGHRCTSLAFVHELCVDHWHQLNTGRPVYDFHTGEQLRPF
ncbi:hypothetical protein [Actinophytocola sp. KF-1]